MLYTRKGDNGTTKKFDCDQRFSKSSAIAEALGCLDEANSFLGLCKVKARDSGLKVGEMGFESVVDNIQQNLFIIQAAVAGAPKNIAKEKINEMEEIIDAIEKELPPIKTFFVSGGCELSSLFDIARTLVRKAERRVVAVYEEGKVKLGEHTLPYLNRLSSLLYALARLSNYKSGINEKPPLYK